MIITTVCVLSSRQTMNVPPNYAFSLSPGKNKWINISYMNCRNIELNGFLFLPNFLGKF